MTPENLVKNLNEDINIRYQVGFGGRGIPEMLDPEWRSRVMRLCEGKFSKFYFSPPDHLDEWTFVAYK